MHSFSMNNYYDYVFWNGKNYIKKYLRCLFQTISSSCDVNPSSNFPVSINIYWLFYHTAGSLFSNLLPLPRAFEIEESLDPEYNNKCILYGLSDLCLPVFSSDIDYNTRVIYFFSILFFCYISFFEIAHQFEHFKMEDNYTIIEALGVKRSVIMSTALIILVSSISRNNTTKLQFEFAYTNFNFSYIRF